MTVKTDRFRTYVTQTGFGLEALAKQQSKHVDFAVLVVGDGELPDSENPANQTNLINQVRHYPVTIEQDPTNSGIWIARAEIPADDGDFFIREAGVKVVNENGALYSYARQPGDYKPVLEEGNAKSYTIRLKFIPGNASVVEAKIDPSVQFATPTDLSNAIKEHEDKQDPHPKYAKGEDLTKHLNANNPHPQYVNKNEQSVMNLFWENQNFNVPGKDGTLTEVEQTFTAGQEFSKGWFVKSGTLIASLSDGRLVRNGHSTAVISRKYKKNKSGLPKASELIASIEGKDGQRRYSTDVDEITIGEDSTHVWMDINTQPTYYDIGAPCLSHQKAPPLPLSDVDSAKSNIVPLITTEEGWGNGVLLDWSNAGYKTSDLKGLLIVVQVLTGTVTMQGEYSQFHPSSRAIGNRLFGVVMNDPEPLSNYTVMGGIEEVTDTTAKTFLFDVGYTGLVFGVYGVL